MLDFNLDKNKIIHQKYKAKPKDEQISVKAFGFMNRKNAKS